jgi:hypothetical protein
MKLESLLSPKKIPSTPSPATSPTTSAPSPTTATSSTSEDKVGTEGDNAVDIPDYLKHDAEVVGFADEQNQVDIYNYALAGTLPLVGTSRVFDVGAGRGDLYHHIVKNYGDSLDISYSGVENNAILCRIGNDRMAEDGIYVRENFSMKNEDYLKSDTDLPEVDWTFVIGTLNVNYGYNGSKWDYLRRMLERSFTHTRTGTVFILLHDSLGVDQYVDFPIPNVTDLVLEYGRAFSVDYVKFPAIYKLVVYTNLFFNT